MKAHVASHVNVVKRDATASKAVIAPVKTALVVVKMAAAKADVSKADAARVAAVVEKPIQRKQSSQIFLRLILDQPQFFILRTVLKSFMMLKDLH